MAYARCMFVILIALCASPSIAAKSDPVIGGLKTEYQSDPLGLDVAEPRFSWRLNSRARGAGQSAYEIRVATDAAALRDASLIWDSGKINSRQSVFLSYGGPALHSRTRYFWQVRAWDERGSDLGWSRIANWEMGLLSPAEWSADWISPAAHVGGDTKASPMLRRNFELGGRIERARVYVTSHGLYELFVNGHRVGDQLMTPGWTSYNHRPDLTRRGAAQLATVGIEASSVLPVRTITMALGALVSARSDLSGRTSRNHRRQRQVADGAGSKSRIPNL